MVFAPESLRNFSLRQLPPLQATSLAEAGALNEKMVSETLLLDADRPDSFGLP